MPIFGISIWDAVIGAIVGVAIASAQNLYLKRAKGGIEGMKRFGLLGAKAGAIGGAGLVVVQIVAGRGPLSMTAAWAVESCLMGIVIAPIIPNLASSEGREVRRPRRRPRRDDDDGLGQ